MYFLFVEEIKFSALVFKETYLVFYDFISFDRLIFPLIIFSFCPF